MARRRTPPPSAYERRNARARALGYHSYYDYRAHDNGRLPPGEPRLRGERLARVRGHRSAGDLARTVRPGTLVMVTNHSERGPDGRYKWVEIVTVTPDGRERAFRLRGRELERGKLSNLIDRVEARGGVLSPSPSLDVRRFA